MPALGQSAPPVTAPGAAEIANLQSAKKPDGTPAFSSQDIARYQRDTTLTLLHAGYSVQKIEEHWGIQPPHSPEVAAHVANNMQRAGWGGAWDFARDVATAATHPAAAIGAVADELKSEVGGIVNAAAHPFNTADHAVEAFEAGWGAGVTGLAVHAAKGDDLNKAANPQPQPELFNSIAQASGQALSDLPGTVLGFFGGTVAGATGGAAIPGAGETGVSEVVGSAAGGAFGAGATPQAMRETIMDAYNRNQLHSFSDVVHVLSGSAVRVGKAGLESLPFGAAGAVEGKLADAGASSLVAKGGGIAAATAGGVAIGAALNGQVPDAKDFVTAAATMLVISGVAHAGVVVKGVFKPSAETLHVQHNMEEIYRRNGTLPWDQLSQAKNDAGMRQELLQQDVNGHSVAPRLHANAPAEPPPIKPAAQPAPEKEAPPAFTETKRDPDGTIFLNYTPSAGGKPLQVKMAIDDGVAQIAANQFGKGANSLGPAQIRAAMTELKSMYPEITSFEGFRRTGAGVGRVQSIAAPPAKAPIVTSFEDLSTALEGSRDDSVSPAGAIGKHQIMIGTARQYGFGEGMSPAELAQWLHDPANNAQVFHKIAADLHARFHGDMNAMLIAYNAGPGKAGEYMKAGPGTELEAIPDKTARSGIRYESVPSERDESFLPMETQKYLANGRRRSGGTEEATGASGGSSSKALAVFPSDTNHTELEAAGGGGGGKVPAPPGDEPPDDKGPGGDGYWQKAPYDHAVDEIMANIGEPPKPASLLDPDRMMEQYVSELTPARNIDTGLVREGGFDRNKDVGQEDMFRQTYASDTRTGAFVRFGVLKIADNEIKVVADSPSVMKAADEVRAAGGDMRGWTAYMLAKRTLDKDKQGIKTGFNLGAAARVVAGPDAAKYAAATETFNRVMDGGLEYGRDSGLFSQKQIDAMMRDNPSYISMRRVMGDNESFGTGKRGFAARDPLRQMEGSDRQIIDPIHATIDNLRVIVAMADRNRAVGSIIGQVEAGKLDGLGMEKVGEVTVSAGPDDPFKPYGLDGKDADATYSSLLAERSQKGLAPNEFIYYRNGVAERWSAKNPALVTLMRKSVGPGEANAIGKVFDKIASLDRAGIVLEPSFPTRITLRHQVTAFIADPLHPPPFLTWMSGIHDVLTQSGVFQEWLANGGAGTALADMDVKWLQRDMESTFQDQGVFARMWNTVRHPLEAAQFVSERIDAAARVGYYKQALAADRSPLKAATMSRKAMLDYAERASLPIVNSIARKVPFLRPKILGIKMFAENFADRPVSTAAYGAAGVLGYSVAAVTLTSMALYAANYYADKNLPDTEKYSAIPRWIRDTHWVTPPIAGSRIQFPYPFVVGTFFGGLVNRFLDSWVKSDPHAFDNWASSILSDYNPFEMMPTAIKTPVEAVANYNFMSGHAIVPSSVEAADGYMQYTNATTEPAKALSRWLGPPGLNLANFSPMQTEHWIDGWTGPIGIGVLKAVNGTMTDYKPPHQMADTPIVGTFFVRNPEMHAQQIEDFYTDLKSMEAAHADWALALKHGDEGEIATAANGPFYGLRIVGKIAAALRIQAAAVSAVNNDKTLKPTEKSQAVDQILNSMIQLSVMGSGVTATIQGKEPGQAFKELDKSKAMATAVATQ